MRVLGIDPGLAIVGYSIIETDANKIKMLEYGCIKTEAEISTPDRLNIIFNRLNEIIKQYNPEDMAIEELFYNKNVKTVISIGQARGVEVLSGISNGLQIYEYTPLQIKQAVVGYGRAEKKQIQNMVKFILGLDEIPKPDDAADALAVAICHSFSLKFKENFKMK